MNFYLNQKEIAAKECIYKNRPEMHCNGKCFLAKQLRKADAELESQKEKQEGSFSHLKVIESAVFVLTSFTDFQITNYSKDKTKSFFYYKNSYFFEANSKYFHPPA